MKNVHSTYHLTEDDEGKQMFSLTFTAEIEGDGPTDMQALQAIDHVLSTLPGCNENDGKGNSRKDAIVSKWKSFRELTA